MLVDGDKRGYRNMLRRVRKKCTGLHDFFKAHFNVEAPEDTHSAYTVLHRPHTPTRVPVEIDCIAPNADDLRELIKTAKKTF